MRDLLLIAAALSWSLASAVLGWAQVVRLRRATSGGLHELIARLKRLPYEQRGAELATAVRAGTHEERIALAWAGASDDEHRVALLNDALSEIDHALDRGRSWPPTALRLA